MGFTQIKTENLEEAITEVIAFFDLFDYPLTAFEIWQYCRVKSKLAEVISVLDNKNDAGFLKIIDSLEGFYFLNGRSNIIKIRKDRYNYTDKKFKRAVMIVRIFKIIPWLKMIAVGNLIGAHNLKKESDIDLFIVVEKGRIWISRFFCVLIAKFLGLRPKPGNERDKICLSFFISEDQMDLSGLMLDNNLGDSSAEFIPQIAGLQNKDIYFIYWLAGLTSVYNQDDTYKKFIGANNWIKADLPNWQPGEPSYNRQVGRGFSKFYHDVVDMLLGGTEKIFTKIQLKLMPLKLKEIINKDTRVVVNDKILKLHVKDRREEYKEKFKKKLKETIYNEIN